MSTSPADFELFRQLLQRYARGADARDAAALRELFRPDATIDGARGRTGLDDWLATMDGPRPFPTGMHVLGEPLVQMGSDGDSAELDTYAVVYMIGDRDSGQQDLTLGIRYRDRVVRSGDGWVFAARDVTTVWSR